MLDLAEVFNPRAGVFQTVSKAKLFAEFLEPLHEVFKTVEDAEAALRFLILERMVEVGGDVITVHPRFPDMFTASLAFDDLARLR